MKIQNINAARRAKPFKPFTIHTGPGEVAMLDLDHITEVTYQPRVSSPPQSGD